MKLVLFAKLEIEELWENVEQLAEEKLQNGPPVLHVSKPFEERSGTQ